MIPALARPDRLWQLTWYCAGVGVLLLLAGAWLGANGPGTAGTALLIAAVALVGAGLLRRLPWLGMLLLAVSAGAALGRGAVWLLPAAVVAAIWTVRHSAVGRRVLGLVLFVCGVIGVHMGVMALLSLASGQPLPGLPAPLSPPLTLAQALEPLWLLPAALTGAWLLVPRRS